MVGKIIAFILTKVLTPKNVKNIIIVIVEKYIANIKNDKKTDWQDTHLLSILQDLVDTLNKDK